MIGFSYDIFDHVKVKALLNDALDEVVAIFDKNDIEIVSGWTDMGIPALAYRIAKERGWKTGGVACAGAVERWKEDGKWIKDDTYVTDWTEIVGKNWGEESSFFLENFDVLVRVGGGKNHNEQCFHELEAWKAKPGLRPVLQRDFELLPEGSAPSLCRKKEVGM